MINTQGWDNRISYKIKSDLTGLLNVVILLPPINLLLYLCFTDFSAKLYPYFIPNTKIDSRSIQELQMKDTASKILGANINYLHDL